MPAIAFAISWLVGWFVVGVLVCLFGQVPTMYSRLVWNSRSACLSVPSPVLPAQRFQVLPQTFWTHGTLHALAAFPIRLPKQACFYPYSVEKNGDTPTGRGGNKVTSLL